MKRIRRYKLANELVSAGAQKIELQSLITIAEKLEFLNQGSVIPTKVRKIRRKRPRYS